MSSCTPPSDLKSGAAGEQLRALHRKCFAEMILLSPEALADEFPELLQLTKETRSVSCEEPAEGRVPPD